MVPKLAINKTKGCILQNNVEIKMLLMIMSILARQMSKNGQILDVTGWY